MFMLLLALAQPVPDLPEPLRNFMDARLELQSGRVTCVITNGPRIFTMPEVVYSMQLARNGQKILSYEGDTEGVYDREPNGDPIQIGRTDILFHPDTAYRKESFDFGGRIADREFWKDSQRRPELYGGNIDLRAIGMAWAWEDLVEQPVEAVLPNLMRDCTGSSVQRRGAIHEVTLEFPEGRQMVYEIDASKGWNATRIRGAGPRGPWECEIELAQTPGADRFPSRVRCVTGERGTEYVITQARFNQPDDPTGWTPADIGFEPGMGVQVAGKEHLVPKGWTSKPAGFFWDGEKPTTYDEAFAKIRSGEIQPGPQLAAMRRGEHLKAEYARLAELRMSPKVLESVIGKWDFYVARFCEYYNLDAD